LEPCTKTKEKKKKPKTGKVKSEAEAKYNRQGVRGRLLFIVFLTLAACVCNRTQSRLSPMPAPPHSPLRLTDPQRLTPLPLDKHEHPSAAPEPVTAFAIAVPLVLLLPDLLHRSSNPRLEDTIACRLARSCSSPFSIAAAKPILSATQ